MLLEPDASLAGKAPFLYSTNSAGLWQTEPRFSKGYKTWLKRYTYVVPNDEIDCCLKPPISRPHCTRQASGPGAMWTIKQSQLSSYQVSTECIVQSRQQGRLSLFFFLRLGRSHSVSELTTTAGSSCHCRRQPSVIDCNQETLLHAVTG